MENKTKKIKKTLTTNSKAEINDIFNNIKSKPKNVKSINKK